MTVADDLATLRQPWRTQYERDQAAKRVEAEVARLERERDFQNQVTQEAIALREEYIVSYRALKDGVQDILTIVAVAAEAGGHELVGPMDESEALARIGGKARALLAEDGAPSVEMYEGDLPTMDGAA